MRNPGDPIRLFITDDHVLVREGLRQLFGVVPEIEVVGEAADGAQLLEQLDAERTDLLLLDMRMPGLCGQALIARVRSRHPRLPILVLSSHEELPVVEAALRAGANGYVGKDRDPESLLAAIRQVASGACHVDARLAPPPAPGGSEDAGLPRGG